MNWKFWAKRTTGTLQVAPPRYAYAMSSGVPVTEDTAKKVAAFYRGIVYISTQIAKLPWEVKSRNNERVDNAIYTILNVAPNDEMNSYDFKVNIIQQAIVSGNGYAEIERNRVGEPVALHLLNHKQVQKLRAPDNTILYHVRGEGDVPDVYLPYQDVFHVKNFITVDGQIGNGVSYYAQTTLGIAIAADNTAGALFANGGMPGGTLEVPGRLSDEAYARVKEDWKASHGGQKTGGTAILEEGMKYSPVTFSPDHLQFLESRKFGVLEIARFLGLPPTKLFDGDSATYNNIEHSNLEVATDTLDAWARSLESEADVKLLNKRRGGLRTEFDMYAVFRGDMATRATYFKAMLQNAAVSPNEIRNKEGLPPYEGGDRFFIPTNNLTPHDRLDEVIDSQVASKNPEPTEERDESEEELNNLAVAYFKKKV
jgi:HK97 family phage portal protein